MPKQQACHSLATAKWLSRNNPLPVRRGMRIANQGQLWVKSGHLKTDMKRLFRARTPIAAFCVNRASMDADHAERHVPIWRTRARYGVEKCMIHVGFAGAAPSVARSRDTPTERRR